MRARSLFDVTVRDEAKEVRPDARPQARKNWRRIRWNTLRIFRAENDTDGCGSFAAVGRSMSDWFLWIEDCRMDGVADQFISTLKALEFHEKVEPGDLASQLPNEGHRRGRRAPCS
jgi:hypothetical protein